MAKVVMTQLDNNRRGRKKNEGGIKGLEGERRMNVG